MHTSAAAQIGGGEESIKNGPGPKTGAVGRVSPLGAMIDVRFVPKADIKPLLDHLIGTARSDGGTVTPMVFAVLALMTSSKVVGCSCCTGYPVLGWGSFF